MKDLATILENWPATPGAIRVRQLVADDGEQFLQVRVDLGVLQFKLDGRPDGEQPYGCDSMLDYFRGQVTGDGRGLEISDGDQEALTREMLQYYRRRISLIALAEETKSDGENAEAKACYTRAIRDAEHNLALLDLLGEHCEGEAFVENHEQYRPFILMHRTVCQAERALLNEDPDEAIERLKAGIADIESCAEPVADAYEPADETAELADTDHFIESLRRFERHIRKKHRRRRTLTEQLEDAIAAEDFERAASLRDDIEERRLSSDT